MAYLDIAPMLQAMRARPSEFEMQAAYFRHIPSQHLVEFDALGNARVHARCDCAMLEVSRAQSEELTEATAAWKIVYWQPHLAWLEAEKRAARINRQFAAHFRPPNAWRRLLQLLRREPDHYELAADALSADAAGEVRRGQAPAAPRREFLPS